MSRGYPVFILQRLLAAIPTMLAIIAISFFMMRLAPGGPFDRGRPLAPEIRANLEAAYGLDQPVWAQFLRYLGGLLRGDFGPSFKYRDISVTELIANGAPVSFLIGGLALALAMLLGIAVGSAAAWRKDSSADRALMTLSLSGVIMPGFVLAPMLIILFSVQLRWLPVAGWSWSNPRYWVLPVVALALPMVAAIARLMRASLIEVLRSNHIRTARAKGLSEFEIYRRHALPPALLPVVSFLGPAMAGILTGSVVVETIFALPGLGRYFIQGTLNRDYTLVMGTIIFYAALIIACNLIVDLIYGLLDPKLRRG